MAEVAMHQLFHFHTEKHPTNYIKVNK